MESTDQQRDIFVHQRQELPPMLNVLTILTFIGCALAYLGTLWGFYQSSNYETERAKIEESMGNLGEGFGSRMVEGSLEVLQKNYENRYILLVSGLLFTTLCLVGALQMRKLKKSGYLIYVVGELAPVVITAALIGFSFIGGLTTIFSAVFALLFVILYSTQRKYLVH